MTINKAQGQTLTRVGVHLPNPGFSHGQPQCVAWSREGVRVLVPGGEVQGVQGAPAGGGGGG